MRAQKMKEEADEKERD
jgi:hypothetical protein